MKFYCIELPTTTIEIELSDHAVAQKWVIDQNILPVRFNYEIRPWYLQGSPCNKDHPRVKSNILALKNSVDFLKTKVVDFDFSESTQAIEEFEKTSMQAPLNVLHRHFTWLVMFHKTQVKPLEIWQTVQQINTSVHTLEALVASKHNILRHQYPSMMFSISFTEKVKYLERFGVWKKPITETFDHRVENIDFNVWMNEDILGKDLIRCYLDGDNPNNLDIQGNNFYTPNIIIDTNYAYRNILQSSDFNKWLDSNLLKPKLLNRYPIGNVRNIDDLLEIVDSKISKVYFKEEND